MIFTKRLRDGVRRGDIRCSIRIWQRPRVTVGTRYQMQEGEIEVESVLPIAFADITPELARESGFKGVVDLLKVAKHGRGENVYLVRFHFVPPAAESFEQYRARVLGYLGGRDPLRVQAATTGRLQRLTDGVSSRALKQRPAPGKWCVAEIVAHLADAELAMGWRLRSMLATPGVRLQWWDEHLWSEVCGYSRIPVARSLAVFRALRAANLALLRSIPRRQWDSSFGVHDKRGRQTISEFVTMEAAHDLNHLRQVAALLKPRG